MHDTYMFRVVCLWEHSLITLQLVGSWDEGVSALLFMTFDFIVIRWFPCGLSRDAMDSFLRRWGSEIHILHLSGKFSLLSIVMGATIISVADRWLSVVPVGLLRLQFTSCSFVIVLVAIKLSTLTLQWFCWLVQVIHLLSRQFVRFVCPCLVLLHGWWRVVKRHTRRVSALLVLSSKALDYIVPSRLLPCLVSTILVAKNVWILIRGSCDLSTIKVLPRSSNLVRGCSSLSVENVCVVLSALELPSFCHILPGIN